MRAYRTYKASIPSSDGIEAKPRTNDYEYIKNARADLEQSGYKTLKKAEYRKIIKMIKAKNPQPPQAKPPAKAKLDKLIGKVVFVKEHVRKFPRQTRL